jgi:hypothetical protein
VRDFPPDQEPLQAPGQREDKAPEPLERVLDEPCLDLDGMGILSLDSLGSTAVHGILLRLILIINLG